MLQVAMLLLVIILFVAFSYSRRRADTLLAHHGVRRWKVAGIAFVDAFRVIVIVVAICGIMYVFPYPLYIPDVLFKVAAFGVFGAVIALVASRSRVASNVLYLLALLLVLFNYYLVFTDVMANAYNYYGPQDVYFPFMYLHGWEHVASIGFAAGFLLTNELVHFVTRHNDGGDSAQRGLVITLMAIFIHAFSVYASWGLIGGNFPGGRIEVWFPLDLSIEANWGFFVIFLVALLLAFAGLFLFAAKAGYLHVVKRFSARNIVPGQGQKLDERRSLQSNTSFGSPRVLKRYQAVAIMIIATVSIGLGGALSMESTFEASRHRPLVYYTPNEYAFWIANSTERISPSEIVSLNPANIVASFTLSAAANEYEAFQLVWTSLGKSMKGLSFGFTSFERQGGGGSVLPNCFTVRHEQNIIDDAFPDVLVPFNSIDLRDSRNHAFWVSVRLPYSTIPGNYSGIMKLYYDFNIENSFENSTIQIPFIVHVYNFTVPYMRHLRTQIGSPRSASNSTVQNFIDHRMNDYGIDIPSTWNGTNYTCDWTTWDANIQWKLASGANSFVISGGPGWAYNDGRTPFIDNATRMAYLTNWLKVVQQHLVAKGWTRQGYIYYIDEFQMFIPAGYDGNRTSYFADIEAQLQAMKTAAPLIRIMTTTPPSAELAGIQDYIDIYCPIAVDYNQTEWETQKSHGKEFWQYYCVGPSAPWPNSHLYNRLFETRVMLWQCFYYRIDGFLYWSSNAEYHGSYGFAYNGWGDGWFIHYDAAGTPYDSPRWENYLDAQEDFEYLWLANRTISWLRANSTAYTEAQLNQLQENLDDSVSSVASAREVHAQHPAAIHDARAFIASMLEQFASITDLVALGEEQWWPVP